MSISRKSSFDTVVFEKARDDPLQFLLNPGTFRKELDLKGLSASARKSFTALRPWQAAALCFIHVSISSTTYKITERVDECHAAIKSTLAVAQMGRLFADDVAALCDALTQKHESPERLNELLEKSVITAEKGYGRSIQAQGQLICVRHGLSQISENIPLQMSKIQEDTKKGPAENTYTNAAFNGLDTCIVTLLPHTNADDDEETDIWKVPIALPSYPYSYLTFQNVINQLNSIAADILLFSEQIGHCVEWWSKMKASMEGFKATLPQIIQGRLHSSKVLPDNVAEGWEGLADQFALFVLRTSPIVKDYFPSPYADGNYAAPYVGPYAAPSPYITPVRRHRRRSYSPRRLSPPSTPSTSSPVIRARDLPPDADTVVQEQKSKPLWKRLSCVA